MAYRTARYECKEKSVLPPAAVELWNVFVENISNQSALYRGHAVYKLSGFKKIIIMI